MLRGSVRAVLQEQAGPGQFLPRRDRSQPLASATSSQADLEPPYARTGTPAGWEQGRNATFKPGDAPLAGPAFTPTQIQSAYRASPLHAQGVTGKGVRAAVLGAGGFARPELRAFGECFGIAVPPTRLIQVGIRESGKTSIESALDLQMLALMAPGLARLDVYDLGSSYFWPASSPRSWSRETPQAAAYPTWSRSAPATARASSARRR